jgi:hypothetical protein
MGAYVQEGCGHAWSMPGTRVLALLCAADLVVALHGMVVMVALPAIERDLGASQADLQWVVTA